MTAQIALTIALVVSITAVSYRETVGSRDVAEAVGAAQIGGDSGGAISPNSEPTVLEAITAVSVDTGVPTSLRTNPKRDVQQASRSFAREALPGCGGFATGEGANGRLAASELCDLWQKPFKDRADAVVALDALNDAFKARFGTDMCLSSAYRSLEEQAALRARKGAVAAPAGQSNHGWGLAIDFCPSVYTGQRGLWMHDVGPIYGWSNPEWAHRGGGGSFEPWHWEFTAAVAEKDHQSSAR